MRPSTPRSGLTQRQAQKRLESEGANELPGDRRRNFFAIVLEVIREPMFLLLIGGGVVYVALGDLREALVLLLSVIVVTGITVYQTRKTERALDTLRDLSSPRALVIRDGTPRRIAGREVVREDLLIVQEGDRVPADGVLLEAYDLAVDEALLTGESLPVHKRPYAGTDEVAVPGGDDQPFVFAGTMVVQGQGIAEITATGERSQMGSIGKALQTISAQRTPLQQQTEGVVRVFALVGLLLCAVMVVLYVMTRGGLLAGLLAGITLAMAVLPEEFPVVLTVFLALGAWRISSRRVLTRRMPAIETLGATTVLCVDKTGTLTENRMAVSSIFTGGTLHDAGAAQQPEDAKLVARYAALASEVEPFDPMERAIVAFAQAVDPASSDLRARLRLVHEYPLSPQQPAMTHCWEAQDEREVAVKGAPEAIAQLCRLTDAQRQALLAETATIAERGQRVLGVARARWSAKQWPATQSEFAFELLGLIGLSDPVRAGVREAIAQCREAGIRVAMITGDYAGTARAIAGQLELASPGGVLTGQQIAAMTETDLRACVARTNIFARVVPAQKLRLVEALKANGEIVAMTGDGVNDAPALKAAHIGVAMGNRGTDVAREAAALVLLDDNFSAIVTAVQLGRRIYDNIRNAMCYLLAVHVPTAGMALLPLVFGWPLILFPVHIVFLEFVIDPACSIAFENEPGDRNLMQRPPRNPKARLFSHRMLVTSLAQGLGVLAVIALLYQAALRAGGDPGESRAMAFAAIVFANILLILINRSQRLSLFATLRTPNFALWAVTGGAASGLLLALYVPPLRDLFHFSPLDLRQLGASLLAAVLAIVWFELLKLWRRRAVVSHR